MGANTSKDLQKTKDICIQIQNEHVRVSIEDVTPETTLNQFLREQSFLTATKAMCLEGGCGSCIVAVTAKHTITQRTYTFAVNSCLVSIFSCHNWKIHTNEGIGNRLLGYHPVQKALAKFNATQCGFCSSGMAMNMYALLESNPNLTMADVENSFGGNLCRCTGYRPILSAFKSLTTDADPALLGTIVPDIEDTVPTVCLRKNDDDDSGNVCKETCANKCTDRFAANAGPLYFELANNEKWFKVYAIADVLTLINEYGENNYMLVGGNTAKGVYRMTEIPDIYIDITSVVELVSHSVSNVLQLGANIPLTQTIDIFKKLSKENKAFAYLDEMANHIDLIANVPVRNIGTLAGNLSIKHQHKEFPSDIFILLETFGATLTIVSTDNKETKISVKDYLNFNMHKNIIKHITLPSIGDDYVYRTYKIMPRAQNAHAYVNAGFLLKLDADKKVSSARIVYGGINPEYVHATAAETYLIGKSLYDNATMQGLFDAIAGSLNPDHVLPDASPEYRKQLAIALCYKFVLSTAPPERLTNANKSGGQLLKRPVSSGLQEYDTDKSMYPITKPIPKIEALAQTTGEAEYILDMPPIPGMLYAAFVTAKTKPLSTIDKVDTADALKIPGVVAFIDKKDIPGKNTYIPNESPYKLFEEELFCSGKVLYYNQPIGVIVAKSQGIANIASNRVVITYRAGAEKPYFTAREVLNDKQTKRIVNESEKKATSKGNDVKHQIKNGTYDIGGQYHLTMETQICVMVPIEDGYNMYSGTQWMDLSQIAAAKALDIPENQINVIVRRVGGAYGSKISRGTIVSTACAIAAHKLKKPVRMWMQFEKNMDIIGKRHPFSGDYDAAINAEGVIQSLNYTFYGNYGPYANEATAAAALVLMESGYKVDTWTLSANHTVTDVAPNTWCRAPGSTEANSMTETMMEHLSILSGIDPLELRLKNIDPSKDTQLLKIVQKIRQWSEYDKRQKDVTEFNKANRWTKKGLSVIPMKYPFELFGNYSVMISIYNGDGSVAVSHSGIECGQGINTKVAQTVAHLLGQPLERISIKPSNSFTGANSDTTGGSITSEAVCCAAIKVCDVLLERLKPIRTKNPDKSWLDIVQIAYLTGVNLIATSMCFPVHDMKPYDIYGVCVTEVEVDILTGLYQLLRMDIIEDVGNSMSPEIDVGQVEGAIVMGVGYWMTETLVYDDVGALKNNRTWNYKVPGAKDIPIDFRIRFERNAPNPVGVLKSKAIAEPPLLLAFTTPLAVRRALASARVDSDKNAVKWVNLDGVTSPEYTFLNSLNNYKNYKL